MPHLNKGVPALRTPRQEVCSKLQAFFWIIVRQGERTIFRFIQAYEKSFDCYYFKSLLTYFTFFTDCLKHSKVFI